MREGGVGTTRHNRIKRRALEACLANLPVDIECDVPLAPSTCDQRENSRGDLREPSRGLAKDAELVGILSYTRALDDAFDWDELGCYSLPLKRLTQPVQASDGHVRGFNPDSGRPKRCERRRKRRVVGAVNHDQFQIRTRRGAAAKV